MYNRVKTTLVFPFLSLKSTAMHRLSDYIRDESGTFWCRIRFAVYTQIGESEVKTSRFGRVSGDFESEI